MEEQNLSRGGAKRERATSAARRNRMRTIMIVAVSLVVLGALIWGIRAALRQQEQNTPGQFFPDQGQQHVALDYQFTYNSNPPTSGPHYATPANWGVYDYPANDKIFIHNMEHGGIWISYKPDMPVGVVNDLKAIVNEFGGSKLVMAPRSANDSDIAVAAWTRLLKINLAGNDITEDHLNQIRAFYKAFKNHGPEDVPDFMPGIDPKSTQ